MKKLKKLSLKEMEHEMPMIGSDEQRRFLGGYDPNDCMWRCFAYLNGGSYTTTDAEYLACNDYGASFDSTNYGLMVLTI